MKINRRAAPQLGVAASMAPAVASPAANPGLGPKLATAINAKVLKPGLARDPILIESIELMKNRRNYFVRVRSKDGAVGSAGAHGSVMSAAYPILIKKVTPTFIGKLFLLADHEFFTTPMWQSPVELLSRVPKAMAPRGAKGDALGVATESGADMLVYWTGSAWRGEPSKDEP